MLHNTPYKVAQNNKVAQNKTVLGAAVELIEQ